MYAAYSCLRQLTAGTANVINAREPNHAAKGAFLTAPGVILLAQFTLMAGFTRFWIAQNGSESHDSKR
tara:strand:+ start:37 stop:240 length:204 start_codon:yes stop_codon:yes gene_type:complete